MQRTPNTFYRIFLCVLFQRAERAKCANQCVIGARPPSLSFPGTSGAASEPAAAAPQPASPPSSGLLISHPSSSVIFGPAGAAAATVAVAGNLPAALPSASPSSSSAPLLLYRDPRVSTWDPPVSLYGLIEEVVYKDPWRLLLACMLLNKTSGKQVCMAVCMAYYE